MPDEVAVQSTTQNATPTTNAIKYILIYHNVLIILRQTPNPSKYNRAGFTCPALCTGNVAAQKNAVSIPAASSPWSGILQTRNPLYR